MIFGQVRKQESMMETVATERVKESASMSSQQSSSIKSALLTRLSIFDSLVKIANHSLGYYRVSQV